MGFHRVSEVASFTFRLFVMVFLYLGGRYKKGFCKHLFVPNVTVVVIKARETWKQWFCVSNYPQRRTEDLRRSVDLHICTRVSIGSL